METKKYLVLDLDHTLTHTIHERIYSLVNIEPDFNYLDNYKVYLRPGLKDFLVWAFEHFIISIWSAGGDDYVRDMINLIFTEKQQEEIFLIFTSSNCDETLINNRDGSVEELQKLELDIYNRIPEIISQQPPIYNTSENYFYEYSKPLSKMYTEKKGIMNEENTMILDDKCVYARENLGNWIYIPEWNITKSTIDNHLITIRDRLLNWKFTGNYYYKGLWIDVD